MDMILHLQREMAKVKMEASHYKRMAEEKIGHVEATLEAFEDLMYQKEMKIESLEFQVEAYKRKLLSLGCDLNASEFELPEDVLLSTSDQQNGENGQSSIMRRLHPMPLIQFKNSLRVTTKRDKSASPVAVPVPVSDAIPKVVEEDTDPEVTPPTLDLSLTRRFSEFVSGTLFSYWKQIKKLDEKVKVISDCNDGGKCASSVQTDRLLSFNSDKRDGKTNTNPSSSLNVHDVFEVPHSSEQQKVINFGKKWNSESHGKHDTEKQKGMLSVHREIKTPSLEHVKTIIGQKKEGMGLDCNHQAEFQKLHQRIDRLESERSSTRQEIIHEGDGEEQLRLLKDIESQVKLMQLEMRSWKTQMQIEIRSWKTPKEAVEGHRKSIQINAVRNEKLDNPKRYPKGGGCVSGSSPRDNVALLALIK